MSGCFRTPVVAAFLALLVAGVGLAATPSAYAAAASGQRVESDDVTLTVDPSGLLHARETIVYDFTGGDSIQRRFISRIHDTDTQDRVFKVQNLKASSPDGGPTDATLTSDTDRLVLKVTGKSGLQGRHTVELDYDVQGAIDNNVSGLNEVRWASVGGWDVPVTLATTSVVSPGQAPVRALNCFSGSASSSIGCTRFYLDPNSTQADFAQQYMLSGDYLTVVVGYPLHTIQGQPMFEHRHTLSTAFTVNSRTSAALIALLVLLVGGFGLLYQLRGREARSVTRKAGGPDGRDGEQFLDTGTAFEPPPGVRPGQIGTLIDEQANIVDVAATIVDFAVRGYLLIQEEDDEETGVPGWRLTKLERPESDLLHYEQLLYQALFSRRDSVLLTDLAGIFSTDLARVRKAMYEDVVSQGWFNARPDSVRNHWTVAGVLITLAGIAGTVALAIFTELALVGLAVIAGGVAMAVGGRFMPAKTSRGAEVLAHAVGFRAHLVKGEAPPGQAGPQRLAVFSRFLPYAIVFDCVGAWTKTVEDAGFQRSGYGDNLYWYRGSAADNLPKFAASMRGFTSAASTAISSSASRSRAGV